MNRSLIAIVGLFAAPLVGTFTEAAERTEHFDADPKWDGNNNRSTAIDAPPRGALIGRLLTNIEWVGLLFTAVLIGGLFVPLSRYRVWGEQLGIDAASCTPAANEIGPSGL